MSPSFAQSFNALFCWLVQHLADLISSIFRFDSCVLRNSVYLKKRRASVALNNQRERETSPVFFQIVVRLFLVVGLFHGVAAEVSAQTNYFYTSGTAAHSACLAAVGGYTTNDGIHNYCPGSTQSAVTWAPNGTPCGAGSYYFTSYMPSTVNIDNYAYCASLNLSTKNLGTPNRPGQCTVGNPCNPATGNKYQTEEDYHSGDGTLVFTRTYNSQQNSGISFGFNWNSPFQKILVISGSSVQVRRGTGYAEPFTCPSSGACQGDSDTTLRLFKDAAGYTLTLRDNATEHYDGNGRIVSEQDSLGRTTSYTYDANELYTVTGPFGHNLTFTWNTLTGTLTSVADPEGNLITYSYITAGSGSKLTRVDYPDSTAKIYHYENTPFPNHLTGISYVDAQGATTRFSTYAYNNAGQAVRTEHAQTDNGSAQERFTLNYNSATQTTVTDPVNMQEVMTFATNLGVKNLTAKVNQSDGKSVQQVFDPNNNLTCRKDEENRVTLYSYNGTNQKVSMTEGLTGDCANPAPVAGVTRITNYAYLSSTIDLPTVISSPSVAGESYVKTTTIGYGNTNPSDPACYGQPQYLPCKITQDGRAPSGAAVPSRSIILNYNTSGQVSYINGPRTDVNNVTTLEYYECTTGGACGQLKKVTNALGHITTYDLYDANGRLLQTTDPAGLKTVYTYDARGRLKTLTRIPKTATQTACATPGNACWQYSYTAWGDMSQAIDPDGAELNYQYDAAHDLRVITDNAGNAITYTYDLKGNRIGEVRGANGVSQYSMDFGYDMRNHVNYINRGGNNVTELVHDAVGNLTSVTDGNYNPTAHQYDALNRLFRTVDALNGVTGYAHDANDQLSQVTAPLSATMNATTQYVYDDLGNLIQETSPDRGATTYEYDAAGNPLMAIDARGLGVEQSYDALNRPADRYSWDEATAYFSQGYDGCGKGRLCNILQNGAAHVIFGYDALGRRNARTTFAADGSYLTTRYAFSAAGRLTQITYPNGVKVNYVYNTAGQVQQVKALVGGVTTVLADNILHQPFGPPSNWSYGNGSAYQAYFDTAYQPTLLSDGGYFQSNVYDGVGNLLNLSQKTFAYDALDRLTGATDSAAGGYGDLNWGYDGNGNRQHETRNGVAQNYTYAAYANLLYNAGGGDVRIPDAAGATQYMSTLGTLTYDGYGQLAEIASRNAAYEYDAQGRRIAKTVNGAVTHFDYGPEGELLYEIQSSGLRRCYVYLAGRPLALIDNESTFYYYHTDHLGTPQRLTNHARAVVWKANYEPFGKATVTLQTIQNNVRYAGQYFDAETGLHYWNSRYYDPKTGRGTSPDRMSVAAHVRRWQASMGMPGQPPLEINPYVAVANNPLRWTDPTGHAIPAAIAACLSNPGCLAAIGVGAAATGAAVHSSGPVIIDPNQPIPPQLPGYVPENQRRAESRVPADLLPSGPSNFCDNQLAKDREQCASSCSNVASKAACMTKALVKYLVCKGKPSWPGPGGDDGGDGSGPFWAPGGGF